PSIQQIDIVRYSWERVCQLRLDDDDPHMSPVQGFGSQFYKALFETDEFCKEKFNHNVMLQARVLASIIAFLTRSPSIKGKSGSIQDINATKKKLNEYQPPKNQFFAHKLKELGASHLKYDLLPYHFDAIGPALITALRSRLKNDCVSHVENAWSKVNKFI
ncbi:hypothetical protein BJ944DRAFT_151906, partial [Cunninghamella echinulata]